MIQREIDQEARQKYVRRIARAVARGDRDLADDLEQDAMLVSLTSSPDNPIVWRGWLRAVTKNTHRYQRFRRAQEPLRTTLPMEADEPAMPGSVDPHETVARVELSGKLGALMAALPETYREVVYLRVVEELPPREVAARLGLTSETVRTRHRRGLALLREEAERTLGKDSLPAWRGWFALMAAGLKRKGRWMLGALAVPVMGAGLFVAMQDGAAPEGALATGPKGPGVMGLESREVAPLVGRRAAGVSAAPGAPWATASLRVDDGAGRPVGSIQLLLRDEAGAVEQVDVSAQGRATVPELAPGRWAAWHGSLWLGAKELGPGETEWPLVVPARHALTIQVTNTAGAAMPGSEVYVQHGLGGRVELVGVADDEGMLRADVPREGTWIAARGEPGMSSRSLLVDQPTIRGAGGRVQLTLNDLEVFWRKITLDDSLVAADATIHGARRNPRGYTVYRLGEGVIAVSTWLPAWTDGQGNYGLTEPNLVMYQARSPLGELLWSSELHRADSPLPPHLHAGAPLRLTGRLLNSEEVAVPREPIQLMLLGRGVHAVAEVKTDAQGRFEFPNCPRTGVTVHNAQGALTDFVPGDESGSVDVGTFNTGECEMRLMLGSSDRSWTVQALRRESASTPEVLREVGGKVLATETVGAGEERVVFVELVASRVGAFLFQSGAGKDRRLRLESEPDGGWTQRPHFVDLGGAEACYASASIGPERLPIEARWLEAESGLAQDALVDGDTGEIRSSALPAGRWALHLLDCHGVNQSSEERDIGPGEEESFGELVNGLGTLRVSLPAGLDQQDRELGLLRVTSVCGRVAKRVFFQPREALPPFVELELPALEYSVTLLLDDVPFVALAEVSAGQAREVAVSGAEFVVYVSGLRGRLRADPGMRVGVVGADRTVHAEVGELREIMNDRGQVAVLLPRVEEGQVVVWSGDGEVVETAAVEVSVLGYQRLDL